ncbi:GMC family oxidoreductase [Alloalcanivorax mobilis]|uniref:GMC family oxidoreductase n=1 Tax=Alloalcanivorax mobilis TaxID=2019569 RepID=UPI0026834F67
MPDLSMPDLSKLEIRNIRDPWENADQRWQVIDGAQQTRDRTLEADVVIIGTGAGGGVSAEILSQRGLKVILVEAGRLRSSRDFNLDEGDAYRHLYQEGALRATKDGAITILQGRTVGGTTVVNWTSSFRTPEQTLDFWQRQYGVQGTGRSALNPWFERMEKRLGVHPWQMPPNANNDIIKRGCEALGWDWSVIPRNVSGCWNIGYCGMGCPTNAKQSMLVTTLPAAMEAGATLIHSAQAHRLIHDGGKVSAVEVRPLDQHKQPTGATLTLKAATVIAAGGGIQTPALLMRSEAPDPNGRVGKRTFLHVTSFAFGHYGRDIAPFYGAPQSLHSDQFTFAEGVAGPAGYKLEMMPLHPGLTAALLGSVGEEARQRITELPRTAASIALLRDGFHDDSVGGTVELRDNGEPVLDYPLSDYLLDGARRSLHSQVEMQFAAGAERVRPGHIRAPYYPSWKAARQGMKDLAYQPLEVALGSAHVMGGCAMGEDEQHCVVDSHGRHRQLENLYVFDGSVFPTSLGVNPQLTIYGLSARNASALADRLKPVANNA